MRDLLDIFEAQPILRQPTRPAPLAQPAQTTSQPGSNVVQSSNSPNQAQQAINTPPGVISPKGPANTPAVNQQAVQQVMPATNQMQGGRLPTPRELMKAAHDENDNLQGTTEKYPNAYKASPNTQSKTVNNPMTDFEESTDLELQKILKLSGKQKQTTNEGHNLENFYNILNESTVDDYLLHDSFDIELNEHFVIETGIVGFTDDGIILEGDDTLLGLLEVNDFMLEEGELVTEGLRDPKDNPCWKGYHPVGTKKKGGKTVPNCVPKESVEEDQTSSRAKDAYAQLNSPDSQVASTKDLDAFRERVRAGQAGKPTKLQDMNPIDRQQWEQEKQKHGIQNEAEYQGRNVPLGKPMKGDVKKSKVYVKKPNGKVVKVNFGDKNMKIKKSNPKRRKSFRARHRCENPGPRWKARYWSCKAW